MISLTVYIQLLSRYSCMYCVGCKQYLPEV